MARVNILDEMTTTLRSIRDSDLAVDKRDGRIDGDIDGCSNKNKRRKVANSIFVEEVEDKTGITTATDDSGEERTTKISHGMVSLIGRSRDTSETVSVTVGEIGPLNVYGVYNSRRLAARCRERLWLAVEKETAAAKAETSGGSGDTTPAGLVVDWDKVMGAWFSEIQELTAKTRDVAAAVTVVVGNEEVVMAATERGGYKAVLCRSGLPSPMPYDKKLGNGGSMTISKRTGTDEFIVIASNGLWDIVSETDTCKVLRLFEEGRVKIRGGEGSSGRCLAEEAAAVLAELAIARGSKDNISVIVVQFNAPN